MIKCIHTGDLHLGSQFKNFDFNKDYCSDRRLELWEVFNRIVDRAINNNVDFLFIAGDIYEDRYFTIGDIKRVRDKFKEAVNTNIIIAAGNHDPLNKGNLYECINWPSNVHIFDSCSLSCLEFNDYNTIIWGYSWNRKEERENLLSNIQKLDTSKLNILLLHGDILNKNTPYLPIDKRTLTSIGFDYVALGHIHKPQFIEKNIAYCGSPEPLNNGELGEHGIIEGTIEKGNLNMEFIPFAKRQYITGEINISEEMTYDGILNQILHYDTLDNRKSNFYRIILTGIRDRDIDIDLDELYRQLDYDYYYLEVIDNTIPDYDLDKLIIENKNNIIGLFIEEMCKLDLKDEINKAALYMGLEVLLNERVIG